MSEFNPYLVARETIEAIRGKRGDEERGQVLSLLQYHREYLRATVHEDGSLPSIMPDGTTVYWSWQLAGEARWFTEVAAAAAAEGSDPSPIDWAIRYKQICTECRQKK